MPADAASRDTADRTPRLKARLRLTTSVAVVMTASARTVVRQARAVLRAASPSQFRRTRIIVAARQPRLRRDRARG